MSTVTMIARASQGIPAVNTAHWLIRLPLAAIILQQGLQKSPIDAADAEAFGLPVALWGLAALGEVIAGAALIAGAVIRSWIGDLMTRAAGAAIAAIVTGVLVVAYPAPLGDILLYNQFHVLLLVGGLFFALRGNRA
ncbi:MAG: hypothetical protein AAF899_03680 [Pseudomonadota bacterium]